MTAQDIYAFRQQFNISQLSLARQAGISKAGIHYLEHGKFKPSERSAKRIRLVMIRYVGKERSAV